MNRPLLNILLLFIAVDGEMLLISKFRDNQHLLTAAISTMRHDRETERARWILVKAFDVFVDSLLVFLVPQSLVVLVLLGDPDFGDFVEGCLVCFDDAVPRKHISIILIGDV